MERSLTWQLSAMAASTAYSTALRLSTGSAPGRPRHTGQTLRLGGSPKRVEQEQKILLSVSSWTCTSSPITGSYRARTAAEISCVVAIANCRLTIADCGLAPDSIFNLQSSICNHSKYVAV